MTETISSATSKPYFLEEDWSGIYRPFKDDAAYRPESATYRSHYDYGTYGHESPTYRSGIKKYRPFSNWWS